MPVYKFVHEVTHAYNCGYIEYAATHPDYPSVYLLKDGTKVMPFYLFITSRSGTVPSYYAMAGELDRFDLAKAFGMSLGEATKWRDAHPSFPKPVRYYQERNYGSYQPQRVKFWSVDEVLEWIESHLASDQPIPKRNRKP